MGTANMDKETHGLLKELALMQELLEVQEMLISPKRRIRSASR